MTDQPSRRLPGDSAQLIDDVAGIMRKRTPSGLHDVADLATQVARDTVSGLAGLNIVVAGKTGVGKSTLINAVFRGELATTGTGLPVTQSLTKHTKQGVPLTVYDTPGFELSAGQLESVRSDIISLIEAGQTSETERIHCVWYCVNSNTNRVEDAEVSFLRDLTSVASTHQVPVFVVITQSIVREKVEAIQATITQALPGVPSVAVLAQDYYIKGIKIAAHGLDQLIALMGQVLPDSLDVTLQNVQKVAINEKARVAAREVLGFAAAAAATGATPIPFTDAAVLVPVQLAMIIRITQIFGISVSKSIVSASLTSLLGTAGATVAGRTIVTNLLKFIPGAGTAVGASISAGTASMITKALGDAYIAIMTRIARGDLRVEDLTSDIGQQFLAEAFARERAAGRSHT